MIVTPTVRGILDKYESDNPGSKTSLARILGQGRLAGTGRVLILPVDQGVEHGPIASFAVNPSAYDPHFFFELGKEAGVSAYAAPLGAIEAGASTFAGELPLILKLNNSNNLLRSDANKDQAITSTVKDALRLGCCAVGLTIYPGAPGYLEMAEEAREIISEAKSVGLASVVWSYPRDGDFPQTSETALDISCYAAYMAASLGAHIIKLKPPSSEIFDKKLLHHFEDLDIASLSVRIGLIRQAAFNGRRLVVFSGGKKQTDTELLTQAQAIREGGGNGSIVGRNAFQRSKPDALDLLSKIAMTYN